MKEITAIELNEQLGKVYLLDVRDAHERDICKIDSAHWIPLAELEERLGEISRDDDVVVHCKLGRRGNMAVQLLLNHGYTRVKNLQGGILAWIDEVDSSQQKY